MRVTVPLAFGLALLLAAELAMRLTRPPPGYFPLNTRESGLYVPHVLRGYALKPGAHHDYVTPDLSARIDISSDGLRDTTALAARNATFRILSVGDSFTMGLAVAEQDTWSAQLERLLNAGSSVGRASVVNAGVAGYSAQQIRLRLEELLPIVRPAVVVYGLTTETYSRMHDPLELHAGTLIRTSAASGIRSTTGALLYSPYRRAWQRNMDFWLNQHLQFGAHLLHRIRAIYQSIDPPPPAAIDMILTQDTARIRADMQPALRELATMRGAATQAGARFIVLLINMQREDGSFRPQDDIYNGIVMEECRRESIECIDLLPELKRRASGQPIFRTPHDQHWTPAAHEIAARILVYSVGGAGSPARRPRD